MKATYQDFFFLSTQIDEERGWVASVATTGSRMGLKHLQSKLSRKNTGFQEKLFPDVMLCFAVCSNIRNYDFQLTVCCGHEHFIRRPIWTHKCLCIIEKPVLLSPFRAEWKTDNNDQTFKLAV